MHSSAINVGVANLLFNICMRIYLNVKMPCVGHRFLISPPDMTCVLPVQGHYIDRYISLSSTKLLSSLSPGTTVIFVS